MRILKSPDVRKQEILDGALQLFAEHGYDKTTISDISKYLEISQGLCYRYFKSKEEIYNEAIEVYSAKFVQEYKKSLSNSKKSLKEKINSSITFFDTTIKKDSFFNFYSRKENRQFQVLVSVRICELMQPFLLTLIEEAIKNKELNIKQTETFISYILYGQLGIILDESKTNEWKINEIRTFTMSLLEKNY